MDSFCIRQTDLPHTAQLFADLIYHPDRVTQFFPHATAGTQAFHEVAAQIDYPDDRRRALVSLLSKQNQRQDLLDRLAQPGTVAVVTGQQVSLFSGPAYTIYKALTAIKLARTLTEQGTPAVPVFWLATEDHDFAEVNQAWIFGSDHGPVGLRTDSHPEQGQAAGDVLLDGVPLNELSRALESLPYGEEFAAHVRDAYAPGRTFGAAFQSLVERLLGDHGVLFFDPMVAGVRELAAPIMRRAVAAAPELTEALLARNRELTDAGYHTQVHVEEQTALFFLLDGDRRIALRRSNGGYSGGGHRISSEDLQAQADRLSPNALLRPVVQDFLLPTVAYVGGPAELAYLAQSEVIYRKLLGYQPVALHRSGFTVLDQHSHKLLHRYGLQIQDLFTDEASLRERIARKLVPESLARTISSSRSTATSAIETLIRELEAFDPALAKAADRGRRKITYQLEKLERKAARGILERDEKAERDAEDLFHLIYPQRHLQERFYSILPFLAKHGPGLIEEIYDNVRLECPDHQVLIA